MRLPDVVVPIATHMAWNPRDNSIGGLDETFAQAGSSVPFPATTAERERTADPRDSIAERYADRDAYLARVREVAAALVQARHVLPEDQALVIANATERWDALAAVARA